MNWASWYQTSLLAVYMLDLDIERRKFAQKSSEYQYFALYAYAELGNRTTREQELQKPENFEFNPLSDSQIN